MIYHEGDKPLIGKYKLMPNGKWRFVTEIYRGPRLVWMATRSCYGRGYWIADKPWLDNDIWKNSK